MFLLFQLLDDGMIAMDRQTLGSEWRLSEGVSLTDQAFAGATDRDCSHHKCCNGDQQKHSQTQHHRIEQKLHSNPQYQCSRSFPKKNASNAMLPRKTPKGIS